MDKSNAELIKYYDQAHMERMAVLGALQNPNLEPFEVMTLIQRLELQEPFIDYLTECMKENYLINKRGI